MIKQRLLVNRLRELLAIKGRKESRSISQRQVAEETGIAKTTVDRYARNEVEQYDRRVVLAMCDYLGVTIADFFAIEEQASPEMRTPLVA